MRGSPHHNGLALRAANVARPRGCRLEAEARVPGSADAVDLLLTTPKGRRVVVEVALSPARARWYVLKARRLGADVVVIITLAACCRTVLRVLRRAPSVFRLPSLRVFVLDETSLEQGLAQVLDSVPPPRGREKQ